MRVLGGMVNKRQPNTATRRQRPKLGEIDFSDDFATTPPWAFGRIANEGMEVFEASPAKYPSPMRPLQVNGVQARVIATLAFAAGEIQGAIPSGDRDEGCWRIHVAVSAQVQRAILERDAMCIGPSLEPPA